ncbi:predicted protein [Chaetomium globosum CBS 148.51]|uniref:Uncharacterized protein n=1 Tax=Chaetomium globosum (strain ATCC 6205 / CBS 148.51 / DSM 1962 / NBRC 6347 / NRRL 1970) TaxID=306901 RepID=Q2GPT9_CHAGB|nr:uncharacterized protein CHGG_10015 [Chaetomium globosum CBS 148.51]EAQ83611.1 predicted protein [Chaetomium globosum CBS 148.51]
MEHGGRTVTFAARPVDQCDATPDQIWAAAPAPEWPVQASQSSQSQPTIIHAHPARHRGTVFGESLGSAPFALRARAFPCLAHDDWTCPVASVIPRPGLPASRIWKSVRGE